MEPESEFLTVQELSDKLLELIAEKKGHYTIEVDGLYLMEICPVDDIYRYIKLR